MSDRFAWGAGDLTPDEVVEAAQLDEGRHSAWNPADHPRANDGKFGHSGGSSGGGSSSDTAPALASSPKSRSASNSVKTGGGTVAVTRNAGGNGGTINIGHGATPLGEDDYNAFATEIGYLRDVKLGRTRTSKAFTVGTQRTIPMPDGGHDNGGPPIAVVKRTGDDTYTVHLRPHEGATPEEIANTPGIAITGRESSTIEDALKKFDRDTAVAARAAKAADKAEAIRTGRTNPADIARRATGQPPSTSDPGARGMPGTIVSAEIPSSGGDTVTVHRQPGSDLTHLSGHGRSVALNDDEMQKLGSTLDYSAEGDGDWDDGETQTVTDDNGHTFAQVTKNGPKFSVEIDGQPAFTVDGKAGGRIQKAADQMSTAQRVDTEYGSYDVFRDGNKFTVRHLGDDGRPVETAFDRRSWGGLRQAMTVVEDGFDDADEDPDAPDSGVTSKDIKTNVGPVRIELKGGAFGTPGSRLSVIPAEGDDWGLVFDGPSMNDFQATVGRSLDESQKPRGGLVSLVEAAPGHGDFQRTSKGRYNVLLIRAGQGSSGYYSEAVLRRDGPSIFPAGTHMHMDHQTPEEAAQRPEGSTLTWASVTTTAPFWDPVQKGLVADVKVFPHWRDTLNEEFAKELGLSIRATGTVEWGDIDGKPTKIVTSLDEGISVDWVTKAGAGGRVLELIESARADGELLEGKGNLAPPFTKADGKAKKDEKPDSKDAKPDDAKPGEEDEDAKKKDGKLPAFLKAKFAAKEADLAEGGTVGAGFESLLHSSFTRLADGMYGEGRLTRDERKSLSSAVGEALDAFVRRVEADQPHLYDRELWDEPEGEQDTTMKGAPMTGSTRQDTPPERGTDVTESARERELTTALAEARKVATALTEAQTETADRLAEVEARLAESDAEKLDMTNDKAARKAVTEALKTSGLLAASHARVTESVCRDLPTDDDGALDTVKLGEAITAAIADKKAELAEALESAGVGSVRGLGESATSTAPNPATTTALEETYRVRGLSPEAARLAAAGRP